MFITRYLDNLKVYSCNCFKYFFFQESMASDSEISLVVNGVDICVLSDEELFQRLKDFGATIGPIVETTRRTYQRKLAELMGGSVPSSQYAGEVDIDEELSDSEPKQITEKVTRITTRTTISKGTKPEVTEVRKRVVTSEKDNLSAGLEFDPTRHTPSPRRSLRSVHGTATESSFSYKETNKVAEDSTDGTTTKGSSSLCRLLVKFIFFIIIFAALYYTYQNYYSESPLIGLEHLAKQALDAIEKQKAENVENTSPPIKVKQ